MAWTADSLLDSVKRRAQLPSANGKLSDADILAIADEEIATTLTEVVREAKGEYWVAWSETSLTSGTRDYRIPQRAQGANLREVKLKDSSGQFYDLPRVSLEEVDYYRSGSNRWWPAGVAFAMVGDKIRVAPDPQGSTYTLRFYYHRRPSQLVKTSDTAVSTISTVTSTTEVDVSSANHSSGDVIDVVQAVPNYDSLGDDITLTVAGSTYTLGTAADSDVAVGDYVVDAGSSPVPQVPHELHPLLYRCTLLSVLEAIGASSKAIDTAYRLQEESKRSAIKLLDDRVQGADLPIVSSDSPLRSGRWWQ